ncbi:MAG: hypothetical protein GKR93_17235 [Gammaproteobacteria bacterium]|nr:hypothetical protein [Gammaproteobacteria bacterium]
MPAIFSPGFFTLLPNLLLLRPLFSSKKIIIHSLSSPFLILYLCLFPSLARKCYWVIWGKDLYFHKTLLKKRLYHSVFEFFRKIAIRKIPYIITFNEGDFQLAEKWYHCNAKLFKSFMYPSNLYDVYPITRPENGKVVILLGNSADESNNHLEAFRLLEKYKDADIEIVVPLSYGNQKYTNTVIKMGKELFANKFIPLTDFIPLNDYLDLLARVDIGLFMHKRQQAMGNITTLLGMAKKVYLRSDITTWKLMHTLDIKVFNVANFKLDRIDRHVAAHNIKLVESVFSEENLLKQWNEISSHEPT